MHAVPRGRGGRRRPTLRAAVRAAHARPDDHAGPLRLGLQEQGRAAAARRGRRLPAVAARHPAGARASTRAPTTRSRARPTRRAVRRAGLQDHDRPVRRQADLLPRLLGHAQGGLARAQRDARAARSASAASCRCTRTSARSIDEVCAGDIAAAVGLKQTTHRRHALRPRTTRSLLETIDVPRAGHRRRHRAEDQGRPGEARRRRCSSSSEEDPTFRVHTDEETGQTIISGMGELHLEIIVDRLIREFNVERQRRQAAGRVPRDDHASRSRRSRASSSARPAAGASTATSSHRRSSRTSPAAGFEFVEQDRRRRRSRGSTSRRSSRASRRRWSAACSPATRWSTSRSTLVDGTYHDVDSSRDGVQDRRLDGVQGRAQKAGPVLLEPIMDVEVVDARGLHGRRHRRPQLAAAAGSSGMEPRGNAQVITAHVPLSEMFGYATRLRSMTQGRATYTMQFSRYEEVPEERWPRRSSPGRRKSVTRVRITATTREH